MFERVNRMFWDTTFRVSMINIRIAAKLLHQVDRAQDRRLARRYANGPGRPPSPAEAHFAREAARDLPATPLKRDAA